MKKYILCALLAFAMLLSSCNTTPPTGGVQDPPASGGQQNPDDTPPDNGGDDQPDDPVVDPVIPAAPSISSVDRDLRFREQARGCSYTSSPAASDKYPDDGTLLTDGMITEKFDKKTWAGYSKVENLSIVVDLGSVKNDLADFAAYCLIYEPYGVGTPEYVCFEISDDGENYTKVGKAYRPDIDVSNRPIKYEIKLADAVSARDVRFSFGKSDDTWTFVGELSVRCYLPESDEIGVYYGDATLPEVDPDDLWPESEQNSTSVNLAAGKIPYIFSEEEPDEDLLDEYHNSIEAIYRLTDGEIGKRASYSDAALVHFTKGLGRTLTFDLSHTSAVSGVNLRFLNQEDVGVRLPTTVTAFISTDGETWECVYHNDDAADGTSGYKTMTINFASVYKARFVRIYFSVVSHVFCDEIEVIGTTKIPSGAKDPVNNIDPKAEEPGYPDSDDFLGIANMLLSYNCYPEGESHSEEGLITVEEFLPHVRYYDKNGMLKDTFFDAFLFLPYASFISSDYAKSVEGWQFYLDDLYCEDRNMDALNQAVGIVADELGLGDYKCTVFTTIIYPPSELAGDVNAQKEAIKWLMDQEYQRFLEGGYDRLEFGGFYWYREYLATGESSEKELTQFAADYAHSLGFKIFWVPYYCSRGYSSWEEYGFDMACMQPNYMGGKKDVPNLLRMAAEKAHRYGMCVEIEAGSVTDINAIQRYMDYLAAGVKYGHMNSIKIYYQRGVPGSYYSAWQSTDPWGRAVYDMTYLYAKELLTAEAPEHTFGETEYTCSGDSVSGALEPCADEPFLVELAVSPTHGDLLLHNDGSFTYYPEEGFVGADRFAIVLNFGYAKTAEILVSVTVE